MKFKQLQLMTKEDKEEYLHKFEDNNILIFTDMIAFFWKLFYYIFTFLMIFFMFFKNMIEDSFEVQKNLGLAIYESLKFVTGLTIMLFICLLFTLVLLIFIKRKWLKDKGYDIKFKEEELKELKENGK